jgi:succinate dehydrogenase hydrophobic anchor subunit
MEFFNTYQTITGIILIPLWGFTIYYFIKETLKFANPHIKSALK